MIKGREVIIGSELMTTKGFLNVTNIETVLEVGYACPLTESGTLLINGCHVSCYSDCISHELADVVSWPIKTFSFLQNLGANENGVHKYYSALECVNDLFNLKLTD